MGLGPGFVLAIVLYILGFAFFTYACIVADPETSPVARFMTKRLPSYLRTTLENLLGPKTVDFLSILVDHALMILYLVLVLGCWSIMFTFGYAWITESKHVSSLHKYAGYVLFLICMSSWRYASNVSPGIITKRNIAKFDHYPYDNLLFVPNRICPTKKIRKLARSKYDRFTDMHIARFDHFCGWLNQPIGEENYRLFLWFLFVHVIMCSYGTVVTFSLFKGELIDKNLLNATFFDLSTGEEVASDWVIAFHYLFRRHFEMAAVLLLMGTMAVVLGAFLGYHIWITSRGMTTNEAAKWKQVKKWHKQALKRYQEAVKAGTLPENVAGDTSSETIVSDDPVGCAGPVASESQHEPDPGEEPIMDPGPVPKNIYDNGFKENWTEVLFPRSLRIDAIERWERSLQRKENEGTGSGSVEVKGKPKAH